MDAEAYFKALEACAEQNAKNAKLEIKLETDDRGRYPTFTVRVVKPLEPEIPVVQSRIKNGKQVKVK